MDNNHSNVGPPERSSVPSQTTAVAPPSANQNGNAATVTSRPQHQTPSSQQQQQQQQRPQTLTPTREAASNGSMAMQTLVLTVNKDATGYGMKVSGDKPVFVESVKPGGAARRAGLMPDDMILKVNGTSVRALTHTNVVDLIKASDVVELTVQRGTNRMQRPSPSSNSIAPLTPVAQRNSITAPQPVDFAKQREMEVHKINTLRLMLEQEKKNLENLNASNRQRTPESARAEATIQKLQKELHQMCGESGPYPLFNASATSPSLFPQPQAPHSGSITPAFLSRFPRSLSSLSLGTKKKSSDAKEISSPNASAYLGSPECMSPDGGGVGGPFGVSPGPTGTPTKSSKKHSASSAADHHHLQHHHQHHHLHGGSAAGGGHHHLRGKQGGPLSDIPPPLPQRNNIPKKPEDTVDTMMVGSRRNILVSDLDHLVLTTPESGTSGGDIANLNCSAPAATKGGKSSRGGKKKSSSNSTINSNSSTGSSNSNSNKNNNNNLPSEPLIPCDPPIMMATSTTMYLADQQQQRFSGGGTAELQAEPPPLPPRQPGMLEGMVQGQTLILNSDHGAVPQFANSLNNNAPANSITTGSSSSSSNATTATTNSNNNNSSSGGGGSGSSSPAAQAQTGGTTGSSNNGNAAVASSRGGPIDMRPPPNSINTLMNYPLITTCTPVRDNMAAAFPLSYRPNIVHQMQQHQQTTALNQSVAAAAAAAAAAGVNQSISKKHRRIVSSPENIGSKDFGSDHSSTPYSHHKMPSDSWDKRSEVTPPGTPPPPYPSTAWMSGGGGSGGGHHHQPHPHQHPHPHHQGGGHLHHHEHTATAGDLAIANPLSHNNNHHHHQQHHQHNNGSSNNNNSHSNSSNHMSSYHHHPHHHPPSHQHGHQSPVGVGAAPPLPTAVQGNIVAAQANVAQKPIISMEDDDISDQESFIEENSPFRSLTQLLEAEKSVYLAVFLNFVLTNSDPSALLFYLITTLYKEGSIKDMRKWAYEIHSTFLVPGAPLLCANVDEALAREIDDVLQKENDKVEILRKVFWRSRLKAKESITQQLQQFQTKRTAGLGTMYGPNDQMLQMAKGDKVKEQRIVEETLLPKLQQYLDDLERESPKEDAKKSALCSALSTVLQRFFVTRSNPGSPIDKVHHFVSREKSFKSRLMAKNRKQTILGHYLHLQPYYEVTRCNHCQNILWGVSPQGYHCTNCELNIHRACAKDLTECCPGPANQKNDSKITKLMEKISSRNHHQDKSRRHDDDAAAEEAAIGERGANISLARQPSDRRQDASGHLGNTSGASDHLNTSESYGYKQTGADDDQFRENVKSKSAPVSVNRSESYKERSQKKTRTTRRKTSDPSLTKTADEQNEASSLANNNYSSSSTSSLPLALDSRSTSLEAVGGSGGGVGGGGSGSGGPGVTSAASSSAGPAGGLSSGTQIPHSPGASLLSSSGASTTLASGGAGTIGGVGGLGVSGANLPTAREWIDSEDEGTVEPEADWSSNIPPEILSSIGDLEKKRQEVINEIYQTERNHVRTLRLLEGIFMRPLQESGALPHELLNLLFPYSLIHLKDLHSAFEFKLKQRRSEHANVVREIGDLLLSMFDGQSGEELREHAAHFCARQQIALEALKERRKKDEQLQRLLIKAESHKACRRLQLKDLLPTALQRLTKYPLLFDNLYNFTVRSSPKNETEAHAIRKSLVSAKRILDHVNQAVRTEEDMHKLLTIQRKLDKSGLDKDASSEFRNIDLTVRKLVHDGPLTMKKNPGVQLHGLLFEDIMVLLQKQDDKYLLKYHSSPGLGGSESKYAEGRFNPITKINLILVRQSAVDKNTFFLINTNVSQMLELTAPSSTECKTWFKHISEAADAYKARTKGTHEYGEEGAGGAGHPPKDSFETVTETQKIEQTSTPIERLERKDTQCRAVSSSAGPPHHHTSPHHHHHHHHHEPSSPPTATGGGPGGHGHGGTGNHRTSADESRSSIGGGGGVGGASGTSGANETEDNLENEEKEKFKRNQRHGSRECNGASGRSSSSDDEEGDENEEDDRRHAEGRRGGRGSNSTRTLTQHCSLVAPSEIHISVSSTLTADAILTPAEQLRRYDQLIQKTLASKQRVVCDMFKVPDEHFQAIADIAAQPEAPKEPTDIVLAAFAYGQSLLEILNEHTQVTDAQQISAVSGASLCDDCVVGRSKNIPSIATAKEPIESTVPTIGGGSGVVGQPVPSGGPDAPTAAVLPTATIAGSGSVPPAPAPPPPIATVVLDQNVSITEDEDGYCEIDEVRAAAVLLAENEKARKLTEASQLAAAAAAAAAAATSTSQPAPNAGDTLDNGGPASGEGDRAVKSPDSHIEINDNYDSTLSPSMTQKYSGVLLGTELCGQNRLLHATSQAPTVPCHLIANYVTGLNAQISQLLHKISEKDQEREQLRRENQHLRELLNAMHQERVLESQETTQNQRLEQGDESQQHSTTAPTTPPCSTTTIPSEGDGTPTQPQQQQQQPKATEEPEHP